jgi:hypothetical protein
MQCPTCGAGENQDSDSEGDTNTVSGAPGDSAPATHVASSSRTGNIAAGGYGLGVRGAPTYGYTLREDLDHDRMTIKVI